MRLKAIEEKYLIQSSIEEAQTKVQEALESVGLKGVTVKKHVPPRYLLVEYCPSWVGKALEIEFLFTKTEKGTEVTVKWPYTKALPSAHESSSAFQKHQEETLRKTEQLIEDFKRKIGATSRAVVDKSASE
jgi:predicted urease superfamily metal-dependent hydrolase